VRFGLHLSAYPWADLEAGLRLVATAVERAGFDSLWVMDHVRQHAVNVMGPVDVVRQKSEVLARHCVDVGRDPGEVAVTQLAPTLVRRDRDEIDLLVERLRPRRLDAERYPARVSAGTVDDQIGRVRELADAGVSEVIVSLPDLGGPWDESGVAAIDRFAEVTAAFRT